MNNTNYINNIFERQSEQSINDLLLNYCRENGYSIIDIDQAINEAKGHCTVTQWGEIRYNRAGIEIMLNFINDN